MIYKKIWCEMYDRKFKVVNDFDGSEVKNCKIKYCPCCGKKLNKIGRCSNNRKKAVIFDEVK